MNERIEELMSIICEGQSSIQREEVENYINNLQSKIDKAIDETKELLNIIKEKGNAEDIYITERLFKIKENLTNKEI